MYGTFRDVLGFDNSNNEVQAKGFWGKDKMVVVATNEFDKATLSTKISVPGYRYVESSTLGNGEVAKNVGTRNFVFFCTFAHQTRELCRIEI